MRVQCMVRGWGAYMHAHCVPGANLPKPYHQTAPDPAQPQHLQQHHALFRDAAERPLDVLPQQIEQARQLLNALQQVLSVSLCSPSHSRFPKFI